jgi:predicted anti-sigma-YlaC factor YlaD
MMTCKEVSTLLSTGQLVDAPLARRLAVRLHLAMCRHCRAFKRQLDRLTRAARVVASALEREPGPDFESSIHRRIESGEQAEWPQRPGP